MHSKTSLCVTSSFIHNISKIYPILSNHKRYATFTSKFSRSSLTNLDRSRSSSDDNMQQQDPLSSVERELLGLERDISIDISSDPRTEPDFPEIRVKGPRSRNPSYKSKAATSSTQKHVYNRAGIEKPHGEWGWSPLNDRNASQWNWKDNNRPNRDISDTEKANWPNAITLSLDGNSRDKYYNPSDLTTFESFSSSSRSATYKAALNVGVHWGKEKKFWNPSMAPYLKGVVNGRHIFDLTLIISNLRKIIRLLQSLIMDECNILFVCNDKDVEIATLSRIMCTRCNMPLLDSEWTPGSLTNWNHIAEHYRGPGRQLIDGERPQHRWWKKTKLHRLIREPPDFIFLFNRKCNDILVHESNRMQIPVASLCDSDDSTRDIQYVIPCNTQSIQSIHFIFDMITRGILEAQSKMDSIWWSKQKDLECDRNALYDAEIEWQYKYDPYQQQRHSTKMMAGDNMEELDIATNYIRDDQDVAKLDDIEILKKNIVLTKYGNIHTENKKIGESGDNDDFSIIDPAEQSRKEKLKNVMENRSNEYDRRYKEKQQESIEHGNDNKKYVKKYDLPNTFQTTSDFAIQMLQDYTTNQVKYRQSAANTTHHKK